MSNGNVEERNKEKISLDMISFIGDAPIKYMEWFLKDSGIGVDSGVKYRYMTSFKSYKHNFYVEKEDYSYFIGYSLNTKDEYSERLVVEFNPNKVKYTEDKYLVKLLSYISANADRFRVGFCDIAIDYAGYNTDNLIVSKGNKRNYREFYYTNTSKTIYLGNGKSNGAIKVYDKASELGLGEGVNLVRYEVTLKVDVYLLNIKSYKPNVTLPVLYEKSDVDVYGIEGLSPTDRILVYAVDNGFRIEKLTYEQRKKYEKIREKYVFGDKRKIEPSISQIESALVSNVEIIFYNVSKL